MRHWFGFIFVLLLGVIPLVGCGGTAGAEDPELSEVEAAALESLQAYNQSFNSRDEEACAATLNYPHVRFGGSGQVSVWDTPEEFMAGFSFDAFAAINPGWDHSEWDSIEIVQSGAEKVHVAVEFSRYDAAGQVLETFKTFHIMTKQNGHWGTQARSSYAE